MPDALDLLVIYGSVRPHRQGIKAAKFLVEACRGRGHQTTLIDPLEERLPLLEKMYKEYEKGQAPEILERLATRIRAADAFIIVSGEYNHSIPPASPICWITSWKSISGGHRPSFATPRAPSAGFAPRCNCAMLCELGTPSIPSLLPVPRVQEAFDEEGHPRDESYNQRRRGS